MSKAKPVEYPFVIYAHLHRKPDKHPRCHVVKFEEVGHAGVWLRRIIGNDLRACLAGPRIVNLSNGVKLESDHMEEIFDMVGYQDWQLPDDMAALIARFKYGTWDELHQSEHPVDDGQDTSTKRAPRSERKAKAQRPDGYITITELCAASGMPAMIARAALRASGRPKPEYGWAFDPKEIPVIKKLCGIK